MFLIIVKVLVITILICLPIIASAQSTVIVSLNNRLTLTTTIAKTPKQRQRGLSHRATLKAHHAMLFVFDSPQKACLWMKNTHFPLLAAFIDSQYIITQTVVMKPYELSLHCSHRPINYALEANAKETKKYLTVGSRLHFLDSDGELSSESD